MRVTLDVVQGRGLPQALELEASSEADARLQAERLGFQVLGSQLKSRPHLFSLNSRRQDKRLEVPVFIEQLRDLLNGGLSVIEALDTLHRGQPGERAAALDRLRQSLREGLPLSDALARDAAFPPLLVALIRASELTSDLPPTLTRFLEHEQRVAEVRHRLSSTAIYPLLLFAVGSGVLLFLLFYVMPRFARVFEGMTGALPWSAEAMVAWAHWLHGSGPAWLIGGAVALAALAVFGLSAPMRAAGLRRLLDHPVLQSRLRPYFLSRWYRATGLLVQGGIPLSQALQLSNAVLPLGLQPSGRAVIQAVNEGLSPAAAHAKAGMATPIAEQLLLAGERSGDLGNVLGRIAHFHESELSRWLERSMRVVEPLVMTAIGLGVGLVVVLMYLPIFELASVIQ